MNNTKYRPTTYQWIWIILLICSSSLYLQAQEQKTVIDKIVAKVDNYIVLRSDVDKFYFNLLYQDQLEGMDEKTAKCKILEQIIVEKMMLAKADIDSIVVESKQVENQLNGRMAYILQQFGGDEKKLEEIYGKTVDDLKDELRGDIHSQLVVKEMQGEITSKVSRPTPKEVRKFFNGFPKDSIPFFGTEVEVGHIVKIPGVNKEQKQKIKTRLEELKQRALAGEDFGELAKTYSEDYGSAKQNGELDWLSRGTSVPEFEAAVFRMKPGELSKIVESEYGFHLIKLNDKRGNEYNASHILLRPNYDEVNSEYSISFLDSLRNDIMRDSISFEKAAKEFSDDKNSASGGGIIVGQEGSSRIFLEDLDSYLFFIIDTMKVGQVSHPVTYRTDDGKSAVRIIYYKEKTDPHQANLEQDYDKMASYAFNMKKNEAVNDWFVKTKEELYISIDEEYNECDILSNKVP